MDALLLAAALGAGDCWRRTVTPIDGADDGPFFGTEEAPVSPASSDRTAGLP